MDKAQRQRGSIVLHKEEKDGVDYVRIEYAGNGAIPLLLAQDTGVEMTGKDSACMAAAVFKLSDFYDRYSPHAYIDYSRVYVRHPQTQKGIHAAGRLSGTAGTETLQPIHHKDLPAYFSDFVEYHKGRNIDLLKVADIKQVHSLSCKRKENFCFTADMRINAIKFYYEQVKGGKRQYYGGITRAKEYKTVPEVLSKNEIKRILDQLSNIKHHCMISLVYSAGLRRSELLNPHTKRHQQRNDVRAYHG